MSPRIARIFRLVVLSAAAALLGLAGTSTGVANAAMGMNLTAAGPTTTTAASAYSTFAIDMQFTGTNHSGESVKKLELEFPPGLLGALDAATICTKSQFEGDSCPASSRIGRLETDAEAWMGFFPMGVSAPGDIYRLAPQGTEAGRLGQVIRPTGVASITGKKYVEGSMTIGNDYQVKVLVDNLPRDSSGIQMKINRLKLFMFGRIDDKPATNGFFFNPAECVTGRTYVKVTSYMNNAPSLERTRDNTPTDCAGVPFTPSVAFEPVNALASAANEFTVKVSPGTYNPAAAKMAAPFRETALVMPEGIQLTGATDSDGNLRACTDAQFNYDNLSHVPTCPAGSKVGTVLMDSPLVGDVGSASMTSTTGAVYLAQPQASTNQIIRLFMLAQQGTAPGNVRVKLRADVVMNPVTKRMEVALVDLPQQPVRNFIFKFRSGPQAATRTARTCGSYQGTAALKGFHSPTASNVAGNFNVTGNCPSPNQFDPSLTQTMTGTAGQTGAATTVIDLPRGDEPVDRIVASLPKGLLANMQGAVKCTRAQVTAKTCVNVTGAKVGTVESLAGQTSAPGSFTGDVFLTDPDPAAPGAIAGLFMKVPVVVGPIVVDDLYVTSDIKVRPDFGIDVITAVPTEVRAMELDMQKLTLTINKPGFMVNPPTCSNDVGGQFRSKHGATKTTASSMTVNCGSIAFNPAVQFTVSNPVAGGPSAFTTKVTLPTAGEQSPPKKIVLTLPTGVSLSPAAGTGPGGLAGCSAAAFGVGNFAAPSCVAASEIGTVNIQTPTIGALTGKAYLGTSVAGHTARMWIEANSTAYPADQARVKLEGLIDVDPATGAVTTTIDNVPAARFSEFTLTLRGGNNAVLSMPRTCGNATGTAVFTPHAGPTRTIGSSVNFTHADCGEANAFSPTVTNAIAPTTAGASSSMDLSVKLKPRQRPLDQLKMSLPAGLLAMIDGAPRCTIAQAEASDCAAGTKIGSASALAGQGATPANFPGEVYLTHAPDSASIVGLAIDIPAVVGPIDLGHAVTIASVKLRPDDYGIDVDASVPVDVKGVQLHMRELNVKIDKPGFLTNPLTCGPSPTALALRGKGGTAISTTVPFQATGCASLPFNPALAFTSSSKKAGGPAAFTTEITLPAAQAALRKAVVDLPAGVALSSSINAAGDLSGCTAAQFKRDDFTNPDCAASTELGTAELTVPQVGQMTGKVYLAQTAPSGAIAGLYLDAKSTAFGDNVRVKLEGKVDVDSGSGKTTATFDNAPAVGFTSFKLNMRGGNNPALSMPRTCGTTTGAGALTPHGGGAPKSPTAPFTIDEDCANADLFQPTSSIALSNSGAGKFTSMTTNVAVPAGQRELDKLDLNLPAGLLANVAYAKVADGTLCTVAQANAGNCGAGSKIGTITTKAGQGPTGGTFSGEVFLVDRPTPDDLLALGLRIDVQVGPIDLGRINVVAPIKLRADYGLDVSATVPTHVRGIPIYLREMAIAINKNSFMFTPSSCGTKGSTVTMRSLGGSQQVRSPEFTITGCNSVEFEPEIAFSATPGTAGGASAVTTTLTMPAANAAMREATVTLPEGVSLSPSAGSTGSLAGCSDAEFNVGTPSEVPQCGGASKIGTTTIQTPAVGALTGDVFLARTAPADKIARLFVFASSSNFPGAAVKLVGTVDVAPGGETTAVFENAPEVPFTSLALTLRGGDSPVLSMPRVCGAAPGGAVFRSHASADTVSRSTSLSVTDCPQQNSFAPTFANSVTPTAAGQTTAMNTTIGVPAGHRALDQLTLRLPAGLLANVDGAPRCSLVDAAASDCAPNTKIGDVIAKAGQGTPATFNGALYLTDSPNPSSEVVGIAVDIPAVVGPVDLGRIVTVASVQLRPADYGLDVIAAVPTRHKGIPLHLRSLELKVNKPGFMTNPTSCEQLQSGATLHGAGGSDVNRSASFQATACDALAFEPSLAFTGGPAASGASAFTTQITLPAAGQRALKKAVVDLPAGVSLSSSVNSNGTLAGCTAAQFDKDGFPDPACAPGSELGTTTLQVPQVGQLTGKVYLAQTAPSGAIAGLYVDAKSDTFGSSVRVKLVGRVDVDEATGKTTATFDDVPSVAFSSFELALRGGTSPVVAMPRTCGTPSGSAALTAHGTTTPKAPAPTGTLTINTNCDEASRFEPTTQVTLADTRAGHHTGISTEFSVPAGQRELATVALKLPVGLLANIDGRPFCAVADAENGACAPNTKIGTVTTQAGQGNPATFTGDVHLTAAPGPADIVGLGITLPVQVGPINLGKVNVVAPVTLRSDYGIDVTADVPTRVKGIPIYMRSLTIDVTENDFMFNPSSCTDKNTQVSLGSASYGGTVSTATHNTTQTITGCDSVGFDPTVKFSATPNTAAGGGAFTTTIELPTGLQSALRNATVVLPAGMSLSPSVNTASLTACTAAQFDPSVPGKTPACPAASKIGSTTIDTPAVGALSGDVYLAAQAGPGKLARVYVHAAHASYPGAAVKLLGDVDVNETTGVTTAVFNDAPEVPFTSFAITFNGGDHPVLSMPRTCGNATGSAQFASHSGSNETETADLSVAGDCAVPFAANVSTTTAPSTPSAHSALTTTISTAVGQHELDRIELDLPAGLVAKLRDQNLCSLADAAAGDCDASAKVGTLTTKAGQGAGATYGGGDVYLTQAPSPTAIVGLAIELPVQVGKVAGNPVIDLGKVTAIGAITLRQDYGVSIAMDIPTSHKGIPLYVREISLVLDKSGFMINPATCGEHAVTGTLESAQGASRSVSGAKITVSDCASVAVDGGVAFSASPANPSVPSALTTTLTLPGSNPAPLAAASVVLPQGTSLTASAGAGGDLVGCTDAQFAKNTWADPTCPAGSAIGQVTIDTPAIGEMTGTAYLADTAPAGNVARMFVDAVAPADSFGDRARIKIEGNVAVNADEASPDFGRTTASFAGLPPVAFSEFALKLRGGSAPVVSLPRTCGTHAGSARLTSQSGGVGNASGNLSITTCPPADAFAPTLDLALSGNTAAGASGDLLTTVKVPAGAQELKKLVLEMPTGLTAKLQLIDEADRCTESQAAADNCPASSEIGAVSALVGVPGAPYQQNGKVYLTKGERGHIAGMAIILPATVGPIDLGKVITIADVDLRSPDLAMKVTANVPTHVKGVRLDVRQLDITIDRPGFLVNPSECTTLDGQATFTSAGDRNHKDTGSVTVDAGSCASQAFDPEISFWTRDDGGSDAANKIGKTDEASKFFRTVIDMGATADTPSPFRAITVTLPEGMTVSSSANTDGSLAGCTDAQFSQDDLSKASACPAGSAIGTVRFDTDLVGALEGAAYLAGAKDSSHIGRLFIETNASDVDNLTVRLIGEIRVNENTGATNVVFNEIPAIPVRTVTVTMRGAGGAPVVAMPRTCGTAIGGGSFVPVNGSLASKTGSDALTITDCVAPGAFNATASIDRSTHRAGESPTFATTVEIPAKQQELAKLDMKLPAGLLGRISEIAPCSIADARADKCAPASKVGSVSAEIGVPSHPFTVNGEVFLVQGNEQYVARLGIVLPAKVGPVDLGHIVTLANLKLRGDYGLDVTAPEIPTTAKGVRIDLHGLTLTLDRPGFMANPVKCGTTPVPLTLTSSQNTQRAQSQSLVTDGCESLRLNPTVGWDANPAAPLAASAVTTTIGAGSGNEPLDAMKRVAITMPEGMSLSASAGARGDLAECSAAAFNAADIETDAACPAGSKVGTVRIVSPMVGEMSGDAYLGVKTGGHFAGLFMQVKAPAYPSLRVKLAGQIDVDPTDGRMSAVFTDLPQVQVSSIALTLRGGDAPVISLPRTCGTFGGSLSIERHGGGTAAANGSITLNADCPDPNAFAPTVDAYTSTQQAAADTALSTVIKVPARHQELTSLKLGLPRGLLGRLTVAPQCHIDAARRNECGPESAVGSVTAKVGAASAPYTVTGTAHMTTGFDGAIAGLMFALPAKVGPIDLGTVVTVAKVQIIGNDLQMLISADDIPTRVQGIPLNISELGILIDRPGVIVNASACGNQPIAAIFGSLQGASANGAAGYGTAGCPNLQWNPTMQISFSGPSAEVRKGGHPTITTVIEQGPSQGNLHTADVVLPDGISADLKNINARVCGSAAAAVAGECPAASALGSATINTSTLPAPVDGTIYLVKVPGETLPGLAIRVRDQIEFDILGQSKLDKNGNLRVLFAGLPDAPISKMTLVFNGGSNGVVQIANEVCGVAGRQTTGTLTAQHGAARSVSIPATCNGAAAPPRDTNSADTARNNITMRPSGSSTSMTFALSNPNGIKTVVLTMPKGAIFTKRAKKLVKPKLTGAKAKVKVTNGERRLRIQITPRVPGTKVTKIKFTLPRKAIKINVKIRRVLGNKKLSKKKREARLSKLLSPKLQLTDSLGKTVTLKTKVRVSTPKKKSKKSPKAKKAPAKKK